MAGSNKPLLSVVQSKMLARRWSKMLSWSADRPDYLYVTLGGLVLHLDSCGLGMWRYGIFAHCAETLAAPRSGPAKSNPNMAI